MTKTTALKWYPWPFSHQCINTRAMAVGHGDRIYVVGTWHAPGSWQAEKRRKGDMPVFSETFHGPTGREQAMDWCDRANRRHAPRRKRGER